MVLKEIVQEVMDIVQDPSAKNPYVQSLVNEASLRIASDLPVPLPDLESVETVETISDLEYLSLPVDFHRSLSFCFNETIRRRAKIYDSLELLSVKYPEMDNPGSVVDVAVSGTRLYYQGIPDSVQTLRIKYYRTPSTLVDRTGHENPSWIPPQFHRRLLVGFACKVLFSRIEDGMDGQKVNTNHYENEWIAGMNDLFLFIGPRARDPQYVHDVFEGHYD